MLTSHRALTKIIRSATSALQPVGIDLVAHVVVDQEDPQGWPQPVLVLEATSCGKSPTSWQLHITCPPPLHAPVCS